jgi:hypothetical protein
MAQLTARQKRRAARQEDYNNQNIQSASDFDFNQHNSRKTAEGQTHISGQEVRHLRKANRNKNGGQNLNDNLAALDAQKAAGAVFGKKAQKQYDRMTARKGKIDARKEAKQRAKEAGGSTGKPTNPIDETVTGESDNTPSNNEYNQANETTIENTQEQDVTQDNDIDTNIVGDNNKTYIEQDNSVRQYGGDNRSFVYNSMGTGGLYDSPVSAATMAGFYDVDDSPSAQAGFVDMYKDLNKNNGTRFAGEAMKTVDMFSMDARGYTPEAMGNAIGKSTQYSFDRADRQTAQVFGDIWNEDYITEDWKMPTPPKAIESNAEEIADDAKDDIDDV